MPREAAPGGRAWIDTLWLVALGAILLLVGLGAYPLWDPDEGRHAEIARRMAEHGRWLVPLIYGEPYYDKPALFYAALRGSFALLGRSELAARLPSALAILAMLALLHRFAVPRFGRRAAALAGLIFVTTPEVVLLGRFCNLDASLLLCTGVATLALLAWLEPPHRPPWAAYAAMGAGVLLKGPVAIALPLLVTGAAAARRGRLPALRKARPLVGLAILSVLVAPWLALTHAADPRYLSRFFLEHNVQRYLSPSFDHVEGPLFFLPVLLAVFFPWSLLLPSALLAPSSSEERRRAREGGMLVWVGVVVAFFSLGRAKLATYVAPAMPALALWMGARLDRLFDMHETSRTWLKVALAAWALALVSTAAGATAFVKLEYPELLPAMAWALALPLVAALGIRLAWPRLAEIRVVLVFAAGNAALFLLFYLIAAPLVGRVASDLSLARLASRLAPDVDVAGFRIQPASFSFYSARSAAQVDLPQELVPRLRQGRLLVLTRRKYLPQLEASGTKLHEWADNGRHVLLATFPRPEAAGKTTARMTRDAP